MFDEILLGKIFAHEDMCCVPIMYQSIVVHVVENILMEEKYELSKSVSTEYDE